MSSPVKALIAFCACAVITIGIVLLPRPSLEEPLTEATATDRDKAPSEFDSSATIKSDGNQNLPNRSEADSNTVTDAENEVSDPDGTATRDERIIEPSNRNAQILAENSASYSSEDDEPVLSRRVMAVIAEVQRRLIAQQIDEALNEMNALYEEYDELSPFEQSTLLNFYSNALLSLEMWEESITAFSLMREIPQLRADIDSRAILALGQLHSRIGDHEIATEYFREWLSNPHGESRTEERTERVRGFLLNAESGTAN